MDAYSQLNQSEVLEIPEYFKSDIVSKNDDLPPVEDSAQFPRVEKIVDMALKLYVGEEEVEDKGKKGGKQAKKEDKKPPPPKKGMFIKQKLY